MSCLGRSFANECFVAASNGTYSSVSLVGTLTLSPEADTCTRSLRTMQQGCVSTATNRLSSLGLGLALYSERGGVQTYTIVSCESKSANIHPSCPTDDAAMTFLPSLRVRVLTSS